MLFIRRSKKSHWKWLVMCLAVILAVGTTSCKDDEDEVEEEKVANNSIIGTWADLGAYENGGNEVFCLRINEDYTLSEMFWYRDSDTFRYEDDAIPYSSVLKKEGDIYVSYNYRSGNKGDCTYTVSGDLLYDTHPKSGSVYTFKRIR